MKGAKKMTEVTIVKCTDNITDEGFEILQKNVIQNNKLLISKANDSINKNRKTIVDIVRPVNCDDRLYCIRFSISLRKDNKTPIKYRILDSFETVVVSFDDEFVNLSDVQEAVDYINANLGKIR